MKLYTLTQRATLELKADKEVIDRDERVKSKPVIGSHIESEITSEGYDIGAATDGTKKLAATIMAHYYDVTPTDPGAAAEAERKTVSFMEAFLLPHAMKPGARYQISSEVLDHFFAL